MLVDLVTPENKKLKMKNILLAILIVSTALFSCRSTKKLTKVVTTDSTAIAKPIAEDDSARMVAEVFESIKKNNIDFNTFSAKVKVDYADSKGQRYDFNTFMRIQKDSIMWVSIVAALGIEAFRVRITPDSVMILDKLNKTYTIKPIAYLQEVTQLPFDFTTLQNLILGNPVYVEGDVTSFKLTGNIVTMSLAGNFFKHLLTFQKPQYTLVSSKLDDVDKARSRTASLLYEDQQPNGLLLFSNRRKIRIAEKNQLDVDLDFKQVEFNKPLSYPFSIPRNYKMK